MSLYLCIFDDDNELDGVEVGTYYDFGAFREAVVEKLEEGRAGSKFPTLILHSDCEGQWSADECRELENELNLIAASFSKLPSPGFSSEWQKQLGDQLALRPQTLYDSFIDVDGEPLIERLIKLCKLSQKSSLPILFQ
jgi:hypothetical protein